MGNFSKSLAVFLLTVIPVFSACATTPVKAAATAATGTNTPISTSTSDMILSQKITDYLNQLNANGNITASVLVAKGNDILISKGFGWADADQHIANTPQTRFRIGSNTKQFTAMAILMLQDRGKLHVTDHLCQYIANCPADWEPITLEELLIHSSGIPNYTDFSDFPSVIGQPVTVEALIDRFKSRPLDFPPGSRWSYSNSGYILLGYIIEKVSGLSYAEFLQQNIFTPLHMANTGYDSNSPSLPEHATGYLSPNNKPVFLDMSEFFSAGALYSTVTDMLIWDRALMSGQLVSSAALNSMFSVHIPCPAGGCALSTDLGYGYGWFIAEQAGHRYDYHWGRIDGFMSSNGFFPDEQISVIVLSNMETTDTFGVSTQLGLLALGAA